MNQHVQIEYLEAIYHIILPECSDPGKEKENRTSKMQDVAPVSSKRVSHRLARNDRSELGKTVKMVIPEELLSHNQGSRGYTSSKTEYRLKRKLVKNSNLNRMFEKLAAGG